MSHSRPEEASGGGGGHDASGMMRWLLTYADMITLLMAFFIMMYSISALSLDKFSQAAASFRAEFGPARRGTLFATRGSDRVVHVRSSDSSALPDLEEQVESVNEQLQEYIADNNLEEVMRTEQQARGLVISVVSDNLLFSVGEAELRPAALALLKRIAGLLRGISNAIAVEGHTCNLPISTTRYPSNWELSAARACSVVRYLSEREGISPARLIATGFADSRPVAPNLTEDGRARNRRVDIVILSQAAPASDRKTPEESR